MGVFRSVELRVYEDELHRQIARASTQATGATLATLLRRDTETWRIEPRAAGDGAARGALVGSGSGLDDSIEEKDSYGVDLDTAPVRMAMTPDPEWLQPTDLVAHALHFMGMRGYRRVLVGGPTGARAVLTVDDVVDFVRRQALRQPPVAEVPRRNAGVDVPCLALRYRTTGSQSQQIFPSSKTGSSGVPSCARAPRRMFSMA